MRRCRSCERTGRVAQAIVFCSVRRSAHARWVEHGGSEAAAQPARRSSGADLAALLEAAEHSAPLRTASRYRSPAALAELDIEPALSDGAPDTQARAGHMGCNRLAGSLLCSASTAYSGPSWTLDGCPPVCAQPCWCRRAALLRIARGELGCAAAQALAVDVAALAACLQRLPLHELLELSANECEPWLPEAAAAPGAGVVQAASARLRQGGQAAGEQHAAEAAPDRDGGPAAAARRSPGSMPGMPEHAVAAPSGQHAAAHVQLQHRAAAAAPAADAAPAAAPALPGAARGGPAPPDGLHPVPSPPAPAALAAPQRPQPAPPAAPLAASAVQAGPPAPAGEPPVADRELDDLLATLMAPEPAPDARAATAALTPAPVPPRPIGPLVGQLAWSITISCKDSCSDRPAQRSDSSMQSVMRMFAHNHHACIGTCTLTYKIEFSLISYGRMATSC